MLGPLTFTLPASANWREIFPSQKPLSKATPVTDFRFYLHLLKCNFYCTRCCHVGCISYVYRLFVIMTWIYLSEGSLYWYKEYLVVLFKKYISNTITLIHFCKVYCLDGDPGSSSLSKMEFFARIVNSQKPLSLNYFLKETHVRCPIPSYQFLKCWKLYSLVSNWSLIVRLWSLLFLNFSFYSMSRRIKVRVKS